jgi:hypothetical protein
MTGRAFLGDWVRKSDDWESVGAVVAAEVWESSGTVISGFSCSSSSDRSMAAFLLVVSGGGWGCDTGGVGSFFDFDFNLFLSWSVREEMRKYYLSGFTSSTKSSSESSNNSCSFALCIVSCRRKMNKQDLFFTAAGASEAEAAGVFLSTFYDWMSACHK